MLESQSSPELKGGSSPQLHDGNLERTLLWYCLASERCLYFLVGATANYLLEKKGLGSVFFLITVLGLSIPSWLVSCHPCFLELLALFQT